MKEIGKIEFNSSKLNHDEMKSIKAGYGGYTCNLDTSSDGSTTHYSCENAAGVCINNSSGRMSYCYMAFDANSGRWSCGCGN